VHLFEQSGEPLHLVHHDAIGARRQDAGFEQLGVGQ
jgi:hypothetical protein